MISFVLQHFLQAEQLQISPPAFPSLTSHLEFESLTMDDQQKGGQQKISEMKAVHLESHSWDIYYFGVLIWDAMNTFASINCFRRYTRPFFFCLIVYLHLTSCYLPFKYRPYEVELDSIELHHHRGQATQKQSRKSVFSIILSLCLNCNRRHLRC